MPCGAGGAVRMEVQGQSKTFASEIPLETSAGEPEAVRGDGLGFSRTHKARPLSLPHRSKTASLPS